MDHSTTRRSLAEDGELEDGEICDDEIEESVPFRRGDGMRRPRGRGRFRKPHHQPHNLRPLLGPHPPGFHHLMPFNPGPHHRGPFPPNLPDRPPPPPAPHGMLLPPPPGLCLHGEPNQRSNFWERSHGALGRFRHRTPKRGRGSWFRGAMGGNNITPPGWFGPGPEDVQIHNSQASRKQKQVEWVWPRKPSSGPPRTETSMDESFEELLFKYKQIQLELECIRKAETMALEPAAAPVMEDTAAASIETRLAPEPDPAAEQQLEKETKKVFQAFNIKPLHQKLPTPAELDKLHKKWTGPDTGGGADGSEPGSSEAALPEGDAAEEKPTVSCDKETSQEEKQNVGSHVSESSVSSEESTVSPDKPVKKMEEEEMSELQLRLLALQSASKKWQQKEQRVMKKSKDRIIKAPQDKTSSSASGSVAAPADKPQRVTTRSASSAAAAAAADRSRSRSKPADRDRSRPADRDRTKQSPKPGPRVQPDRARTPGNLRSTKNLTSQVSTAKQAFRKQQLHTWKLQRQRNQEEKRQQEEEERHKREDEIRRIRDLSNQDEQYNRFMKLVGGRRTRSRSRDQDHRKSAGKPGLDASGNLYQYDNYDEVAMDTDSEPGSPVSSPTQNFLSMDEMGGFPPLGLYGAESAAYGMPFIHPMLSGVPPPPPLPPPQDELEPPPKPPFADEEEEEEMLLRETCLMSMANKRVATTEKSSSGPPSPTCPPPADIQPPPRGNLSTVSLNTVPQTRSSRFSRTPQAARGPLVLPRHKSVVVSLRDSDDSDSDVDACSSSPMVFGGLEFMIKEARRTVEAAKPKAAPVSEKENNPVRAPEALPESKKAEYRLLKEEISSRENQRTLRDHSSPATPELVLESSLKQAAQLRRSEAEKRLSKHRELLQRDEIVLRHLLQQELKKAESLKATEAKVVKLREQLQASEKILTANRTLLKKLQEQVQRVEHRVSLKKTLEVQLEQELNQAQLTVSRRTKRPTDSSQTAPNKLQRRDATPRDSERHFAELIAQKRRLQQLESEYALKIQKLKEAQARRNKGVPAEPPTEQLDPTSTPIPDPKNRQPPSSSPFHLPQPSLHDLSQDKLVLDSEDVLDVEDQEPELAAAAAKGSRRNSLRQSSSSFTKPHLDTPNSAPSKDEAKLTKMAASATLPAETFAGLDVDGLKRRYQLQARLGDLLQTELHRLGEDMTNTPTAQMIQVEVEPTSQSVVAELKPVSFEVYCSPLRAFKSYRFSPYYRTKEKLSLSSVTFSNAIEPNKCFCRFDLTGTCNDDDCRWQHMRNCTLSGNQLFQDILSYNLLLIGCSESSLDQEVGTATEGYLKKLFGPNKDRMGVDQKAVLLVSKVNESKRHVPPFTTFKDTRRWRPKPATQSTASPEDEGSDETSAAYLMPAGGEDVVSISSSAVDVVTSEDRRYFTSETDDISNLEASVLESPRDTQLWIKLAFKYLNQSETSAAESLEAALNTLSRALESNCDDPEVWSHYLSLFSRRGSREEVQEMCEMAVEHASDHRVWWSYLNLENSYEGKDYVCERLLHFLQAEAASGVTEKLSFQLIEALLYRVQLSLSTGRMETALAILQGALKSTQDHSVADHLTAGDRALLWLSYIHLTEFDRLPSSLFDPAEFGPARLTSRESFILPWRTAQDISTPSDILVALFKDAVVQCSEESRSNSENTLACMPLHTNLLFLYRLLQRYDEGVALCESLLEFCPDSCMLRDSLADLHISRGNSEQAVNMWLHTLAECPHNAQVFYHCCKFLMTQDKSSAIPPLFRGFILSLCEDEQSRKTPVNVLRYVLGFPTEELLNGPIIRKELEEQLQQQMSYLHLLHCRWVWLHGTVEEAAEAFEQALGSVLQLEELRTLWMDYLLFSCSPHAGAASQRLFPDLVQRCLSTVPTRLELPFNPAKFWSCYDFHNKVVSLYLRFVPKSQRALVLERLRKAMPANIELGLRLLHQEFLDGNMEQLKFQARMQSSNAPRCLSSWRIAIATERELKERGQMRLLYQQALQNLPLCAALWKDWLLFEAAEGGASEHLRQLVDRCQQAGVSVSVGGVHL